MPSLRWIGYGLGLSLLLFLLGKGIMVRLQPAAETTTVPTVVAIPVKVRRLDQSHQLQTTLSYPGSIDAENQATVIAKTNGTVSGVSFAAGDRVAIGQELLRIDDVTPGARNSGKISSFQASQIKQGELAVEQASVSLQLAQTSYAHLLQSSQVDLQLGEIAAHQTDTAERHLQTTTAEALKTADLAYDTAKLASEQARLALENRQSLANQGNEDANANVRLAITAAVDASGVIIASINSLTDVEVENGGALPYRDSLGNLDSRFAPSVHLTYVRTKQLYDNYRAGNFVDLPSQLAAAARVVDETKNLSDATRSLLDKTLPTANLSAAALSAIQGQVVGYQGQANGLISQLAQAKQALATTNLTNASGLTALQKAYDIAKAQEQTAAQNIENLKAGNASQLDQAKLSSQASHRQASDTKIKLASQLAVAKSQVDLAGVQYRNAITSLQSLTDSHFGIAPMTGTVIKKFVQSGDTVAAGQPLAVIGTADRLLVHVFVDQDALGMISPGMRVQLTNVANAHATGTVTAITPEADPISHRFLIEVKPEAAEPSLFPLGSLVDVEMTVRRRASPGDILVPLSALEMTQNGNFILIVNDHHAERAPITLIAVYGDNADIRLDAASSTELIIEGNQFAAAGTPVTVNP